MNLFALIVYAVLVTVICAVIISENRNPLKATSWIIVISFLPIIGLLVYIVFGQDQRRRQIVSRRVYKRIMRKPQYLSIPSDCLETPITEQLSPIIQLINHRGDSPLLSCKEVSIFTQGKSFFSALFDDIQQAKHHIHIQFYVIEDDRIGQALAELLMQKVSEGVKVRVVYDHVGSLKSSRKFWRKLRAAGVEVYPFMPVVFPIFTSKVNYRNHRKVVVIDGKYGYLGGMNVADRYYSGNKLGQWRDTHFRVSGSVVAGLQSSFLLDWYVVSRRIISHSGYFPSLEDSRYNIGDIKIQLVRSGPIGKWRSIEQATIYCIQRASERVYIETPYFLPTDGLNNALQTAALAGIDVRLILPKKSDAHLPQLAGLTYIEDLLDAGVKVYFYRKGFIHSKLMTVDGQVASIGSTNMDFRSLENNFEFNGLVYDTDLVQRLENIFLDDMVYCEEIDLDRWRMRPRLERFTQSVVRLFSPLL